MFFVQKCLEIILLLGICFSICLSTIHRRTYSQEVLVNLNTDEGLSLQNVQDMNRVLQEGFLP